MHVRGIGNIALAARLGLCVAGVRNLIEFGHRSHIGHVESTLHALG